MNNNLTFITATWRAVTSPNPGQSTSCPPICSKIMLALSTSPVKAARWRGVNSFLKWSDKCYAVWLILTHAPWLGREGGAPVSHNPQMPRLLAQWLDTEVRHTQPSLCHLLDRVAVGEHSHPLNLSATARLLWQHMTHPLKREEGAPSPGAPSSGSALAASGRPWLSGPPSSAALRSSWGAPQSKSCRGGTCSYPSLLTSITWSSLTSHNILHLTWSYLRTFSTILDVQKTSYKLTYCGFLSLLVSCWTPCMTRVKLA